MTATMSLVEAVNEVQNILTGLDLDYDNRHDVFHATVRQLNRSLRYLAGREEWGWYAEDVNAGQSTIDQTEVELDSIYRPRAIDDDAVRLADPDSGLPLFWAYYLPRDSLSKYADKKDLRVAFTRNVLTFSRPLQGFESGLDIIVPCMREPRQTKIPDTGETIPTGDLNRSLDCEYPDMVVAHAALQIAHSNPLYQPRVAALQDIYDDLRYAVAERDTNFTDSPYRNQFTPSYGDPYLASAHNHPQSDRR